METCTKYVPWHDKTSGRTGLKIVSGKCLHCCFYLIDPELGLACVRVPTWAPCRLQVCFNGHHWLASRLTQAGLTFRLDDTALVETGDWARAQQLSGEFALNGLSGRRLRHHLPGRTSAQIGRILKRLRLHGLIRKAGHTCRYYLTNLGRRARS
jgi:hypothetical protein